MDPQRPDTPMDRRIRLRATLLLVLTLALAAGFTGYVLYSRGTFESTQTLVLMASDSEGVSVGADLSFSGFPVGRVRRIELAQNGQARIEIDVPRADARWLRASSVFTLERGLVGGARLRAFTGNLDDAPLPDGAVRPVLRGDTTDELPGLVANLNKVLENVERMTAETSALNASLAGVSDLVGRLAGRHGALAVLLGSEAEAVRVLETIDRTNRVLAATDGLVARLDALARKADTRVFERDGLVDEAQRAAAELNALLAQARETLRKADAALADAQGIAANTRAATDDLAGLRAEVQESLRKAAGLIDEVDRKWPFRRDTEMRLP
jgi:phospholipid/cholesterol/gamma-HCH transport system substrate-binding protein